jgi:methylenetetrahydrofolate dehydrogenase (NADP+) / methenyltetrahydrofolate cyclohydrolase
MIVDGRTIAASIYKSLQNELTHSRGTPHLTIFTCAPNFETQKYLALKRKYAAQIGLGVSVIEFPASITTDELIQSINYAAMQTDAMIVQLPLPKQVDTDAVIKAIPVQYDADGMHYDGTGRTIISPVAGAVAAIAEYHDLLLAGQQAVVVGEGRLVGVPVAHYLRSVGAQVTIVNKETPDVELVLASADVLVLGAGVPHLLQPDMIKEGVIIFDAGTSEANGMLVGDAHPDCAHKASLFTPVPGGIGPLTIAILLRNVVQIARM